MSNIEPIEYKSAASGSRRLFMRTAQAHDSTIMTVIDNDNTRHGLFLSDADAVDLAVRILAARAPERLREPTFRETKFGTYLRNVDTDQIVQVVDWDKDKFQAWAEDGLTDHEVFALDANGFAHVPWQDPQRGIPTWKPVEVQVDFKPVWTEKKA